MQSAPVDSTLEGSGPDHSAPTVEVGGRRATVGRTGDRVLVTDVDCDGGTDALLHRPATGEIFLFDLGGTPTGPVPGRLVHRDRTTTQLLPSLPCGPAIASRSDGSSTPIVTP